MCTGIPQDSDGLVPPLSIVSSFFVWRTPVPTTQLVVCQLVILDGDYCLCSNLNLIEIKDVVCEILFI